MSFRQNGWSGFRAPERKSGRFWLRSLHLWSPRAAISGRERNSAATLAGILLYRGLMEALYGGSGQAAGAGAPACLTEEKEGQRA